VRVYIHEVNVSVGAVRPCRFDVQEKRISFEVVKKPCPSPCGGDNVGSARGSVTLGESTVTGIYADEDSTAEICAEVAYFLGSRAEGNGSRTSGVEGVETVSAMMVGDAAERVVAASYGEWGSCCASRDVVCPPRAFSDVPFPGFLAPTFPSALRAAFVLHPSVVRVLPFLPSAFVAAPPASLG
jgi:hypothetical protein